MSGIWGAASWAWGFAGVTCDSAEQQGFRPTRLLCLVIRVAALEAWPGMAGQRPSTALCGEGWDFHRFLCRGTFFPVIGIYTQQRIHALGDEINLEIESRY